jgi:phosphoadenosine phosphosulfate reductase
MRGVTMPTDEFLAELGERFDRIMVACSFQKEAVVIAHMVSEALPQARFFTLDTGVFFPETYETWERLEERLGITVEGRRGITLAEQASLHGDRLWERDPDGCCDLRKVRPLREVLSEADVWIAGLRRDQSPERADTPRLGWDVKHGLWKAAPLVEYSERDVWRHIHEHDLPYHPLHDQGYSSIGCEPCTRPGADREGRWAGTDKIECGLHAA